MTVSRQLVQWLQTQGGSATHEEIVTEFPCFPYLTPSDLALTLSHLERSGNCMVVRDKAGGLERLELDVDRPEVEA